MPAALYVCYYHFTEPLVQTQVVAYLQGLAKRGYEMHLLTFENKPLGVAERRAIRDRLAGQGIRWWTLRYHRWPSLPATLYDIAVGSLAIVRIAQRHNIGLLHARSHVAAAMALIAGRRIGAKVLFDVRGLLADEYADTGHWRRDGLKYRLTKSMERRFFRKADAFVMLTNALKDELLATEHALRGRADDINVIPCCVDLAQFPEEAFHIRAQSRATARSRRVLAYVGKLGSWYLSDEMAQFFATLRAHDARMFFDVMSQSDAAPMRRALLHAGMDAEAFDLRSVSVGDVPPRLAQADAGIAFYRTSYAKISTSPTKIGEYLAAGLPVVCTQGIGDCDEMFRLPHLGVTVRSHDVDEYRRASKHLLDLVDDPRTAPTCRAYAERELSLSAVGVPRYAAVYARLLGRSA